MKRSLAVILVLLMALSLFALAEETELTEAVDADRAALAEVIEAATEIEVEVEDDATGAVDPEVGELDEIFMDELEPAQPEGDFTVDEDAVEDVPKAPAPEEPVEEVPVEEPAVEAPAPEEPVEEAPVEEPAVEAPAPEEPVEGEPVEEPAVEEAPTEAFVEMPAEDAPTANELVYTGEEQPLVSAVGAWRYSLDGEVFSDEIPTAVNAGEYTVYYRSAADDAEAQSLTVTVAKADVVFTPPVAANGEE